MSLPTVASLWIGPALSWLEQLCLISYADNGHEVILYTYDKVANVPDCVRVEDARAILPNDRIIRHRRTGSPAYHADLFRLHLMELTDYIWVDTDAYCHQPFELPETGYLVGIESEAKRRANNGVLRLPRDSEVLGLMRDLAGDEFPNPPWFDAGKRRAIADAKAAGTPIHVSEMPWGVWGPSAISHFLHQTGEYSFAQPEHVLYPISFKNRGWFFLPRKRAEAEASIHADTLSIHFWGRRFKPRMADFGGIPKSGSFIESILEKHGIDPAPTAFLMQNKAMQVEAEARPVAAPKPVPAAARQTAVAPAPRVTAITCMKDEGPFILEWLAFHKALGVTDFLVFTNHCTDGTDTLLAALDRANELRHMPNPALVADTTYFQPKALAYAAYHSTFKAADYLISMDVDEFLNIRIGEGRFADLLAALPDFDALSAPMVDFGSDGIEAYRDRWVTEQFTTHANLRPGKWRARRGVKSIVHNGPHLAKLRNHRPDLVSVKGTSPLWLDGSGNPAPESLTGDPTENGYDARGRSDLVVFNHYPLRSLDSYLVKSHRGDVVIKDKQLGKSYWRRRNLNVSSELPLGSVRSAAQEEWQRLREIPGVLEAHAHCVEAHKRKIAALREHPDFRALAEEIRALDE